jgi:hypothetical protein
VSDILRSIHRITAIAAIVGFVFLISPPAFADEGAGLSKRLETSQSGAPAGKKKPIFEKPLQLAQTGGGGWIVRQASGPVRREGTDQAVAIGDKLAAGDRLVTGPGGQAVLAHIIHDRDQL